MIDPIDVLGFTAGFFTTGANLPQVIKTYKLKNADAISLKFVVALIAGLVLWVVYGVLTTSWPIIVTNVAALLLASTLLVLKKKYEGRGAREEQPERPAA